jgi:hypothetical protein
MFEEDFGDPFALNFREDAAMDVLLERVYEPVVEKLPRIPPPLSEFGLPSDAEVDLCCEIDQFMMWFRLNLDDGTAFLASPVLLSPWRGSDDPPVLTFPSEIAWRARSFRLSFIPDICLHGTAIVVLQIPSSVQEVGPNLCEGFSSLDVVEFEQPCSLTAFPGFGHASAIRSIAIPDSILVIDRDTLSDCPLLTTVVFGESSLLEYIDGFMRTGLKEICIPSSVLEIGRDGFYGSSDLLRVTFGPQSRLRFIQGFGECHGLTKVTLPDSLERIKSGAFRDCSCLAIVDFCRESHLKSVEGFTRTTHCKYQRSFLLVPEPSLKLMRKKLDYQTFEITHSGTFVCGPAGHPNPAPPPPDPRVPVPVVGNRPNPVPPNRDGPAFRLLPQDPRSRVTDSALPDAYRSALYIAFAFSGPLQEDFEPSKPRPMYWSTSITGERYWTFGIEQLAAIFSTLPFLNVKSLRKLTTGNFHVHVGCRDCGVELLHIKTVARHAFAVKLRHSCKSCCPFWSKYSYFGHALRGPVRDPSVRLPPPANQCGYYINCCKAWEALQEPDYHPRIPPLAKIMHAVVRHQGVEFEERDWFDGFRFSESTFRKVQAEYKGWRNFQDFVKKLRESGFVRVRVQRVPESPIESYASHIQFNGWRVVGLTWIPRWAGDAFGKAGYIQLDCSFKPSAPYVYCTPQAIIRNEAVPLGFIMTPTERSTTYKWFYADLADMTGDLPMKPIISDEGLGLIKFGESNAVGPHYFCYRHLIEKFGARGILGIMCRRFLHIPSEAEFAKAHKQVLEQLTELRKADRINVNDYNRFVTFIGGKTGTAYQHGIWRRAADGISTCSNHAERFHRTVKKRARHFLLLSHRLSILVDCINEKFERYQTANHRQLRYIIKNLRNKHATPNANCQNPKCVHRRTMIAQRFGLATFPCKHQVTPGRYSAKEPEQLLLLEGSWDVPDLDVGDLSWPFAERGKLEKVRDLDFRVPQTYSDVDSRRFVLRIAKEVAVLWRHRFEGDEKYSFILEVAETVKACRLQLTDADIESYHARFAVHAWMWAEDRAEGKNLDIGFYAWMIHFMKPE